MKLFDFLRRKNKVKQEENEQADNAQEENKQENSVEETASEDSVQDGINDSDADETVEVDGNSETDKTSEVDETDEVEEPKELDEANEVDEIEQVDESNEDDSTDEDSDDAEEAGGENEDDEPSDEPDDDIEEDEADDDEIDEDDTEEEDETEDEEDEVEEDDEEREHREISFDYEQFEEDLCTTFEEFMKGYLDRKEDMYIFSVNYFPEYTTTVGVNANSYSYFNEKVKSDPSCYGDFKYCEEEWEIQEWFDAPSKQLQIYFDQWDEVYDDDPDTYLEMYEEHQGRIIDICKNVMKRIKETDTFKAYPKMLLNVYVWEVIDGEDAVEIFKDINGDAIPDDYFEFVETWQ